MPATHTVCGTTVILIQINSPGSVAALNIPVCLQCATRIDKGEILGIPDHYTVATT